MINPTIANTEAELNVENTQLNTHEAITRAKNLLMRQRMLSEDEAYQLLRSMALKKKMELADLSHQLNKAAKMLIV